MEEIHSSATHYRQPAMTDSRSHLRALWNLLTDLEIDGKFTEARKIREAIIIAEAREIDAVGKY